MKDMDIDAKDAIRRELSALDLECAVVDGINIYVRDVLRPKGIVDEEKERDFADEVGAQKYQIAQRVALCWLGKVDDLNWQEDLPSDLTGDSDT